MVSCKVGIQKLYAHPPHTCVCVCLCEYSHDRCKIYVAIQLKVYDISKVIGRPTRLWSRERTLDSEFQPFQQFQMCVCVVMYYICGE